MFSFRSRTYQSYNIILYLDGGTYYIFTKYNKLLIGSIISHNHRGSLALHAVSNAFLCMKTRSDPRASAMTHSRKRIGSVRITTDSISFMRTRKDIRNNPRIRGLCYISVVTFFVVSAMMRSVDQMGER